MRRAGLTAAGLTLVVLVVMLVGGRAKAQAGHTCAATDRQFLSTAAVNVTALGLWGESYVRGELGAREVAGEALAAAARVGATAPRDPSLRLTRRLLAPMFTEYARAILAKARGGNAGAHMYRSYSFANFAHEVLARAEPALRSLGCDVTPLL